MSPNKHSCPVDPRQYMVYFYTCSLFSTIFSHLAIYLSNIPKGDIIENIGNMCTIILYNDFIKHAHPILIFKLCMYSISDF